MIARLRRWLPFGLISGAWAANVAHRAMGSASPYGSVDAAVGLGCAVVVACLFAVAEWRLDRPSVEISEQVRTIIVVVAAVLMPAIVIVTVDPAATWPVALVIVAIAALVAGACGVLMRRHESR